MESSKESVIFIYEKHSSANNVIAVKGNVWMPLQKLIKNNMIVRIEIAFTVVKGPYKKCIDFIFLMINYICVHKR